MLLGVKSKGLFLEDKNQKFSLKILITYMWPITNQSPSSQTAFSHVDSNL